MRRTTRIGLLAAIVLPVFPGASAPPSTGDAAETITISRNVIACAGVCPTFGASYVVTVTAEGDVASDIFQPPAQSARFHVSAAEAARFRAILRPYRTGGVRPEWAECVHDLWQGPKTVKIEWRSRGFSVSFITCENDRDGVVHAVDEALRAVRLDPDGYRVTGGN